VRHRRFTWRRIGLLSLWLLSAAAAALAVMAGGILLAFHDGNIPTG
jgi:hypothetical protein